jgi:hypothetical protein
MNQAGEGDDNLLAVQPLMPVEALKACLPHTRGTMIDWNACRATSHFPADYSLYETRQQCPPSDLQHALSMPFVARLASTANSLVNLHENPPGCCHILFGAAEIAFW